MTNKPCFDINIYCVTQREVRDDFLDERQKVVMPIMKTKNLRSNNVRTTILHGH